MTGAGKRVRQDFSRVQVCKHAVRSPKRRGRMRAPTVRLVAERYRYWNAGLCALLSPQAVHRLLFGARR